MNVKLLPLLLLGSCTLSGCYLNARLYPVNGPLSARTPPPIYAARISGAIRSGSFSATLENGEVCKGSWTSISNSPKQNNGHVSVDDSSAPELVSAWDTVYGQGFYRASVLGAHIHIHGLLNGNQGTVMQVDAYLNDEARADSRDARKGVATDNHGNVYKLAF